MEPPLANAAFYISLVGFIVSLIGCAIFSFLETSITALRLFKLKELSRKIGRYRLLFETLEKSPQRVLSTILIANCLVNVISSALITNIMERTFSYLKFSSGVGFSVGIALATIAILLFGEIIPKNLAKTHGERLLRSSLWVANSIFLLFRPLMPVLLHLSDFVIYRIGGQKSIDTSDEWVSSEKEIQFLIEHINEKGLMETEKTEMLQNIFELAHTPVKEVMVPATDIVSVELQSSLETTLNLFAQHQFSRLPVYDTNKDNIVGMIHVKDIFLASSAEAKKQLSELLRPISFVPESVKVNQLLRELREQHRHIAMVINEYGSITGLVTLEDVLEEIVGEISDEYETHKEKIVPLKQGGWLVHATVPLDELEELLPLSFDAENALTLGGFLTEKLQHLPKKGERLLYKNYYFQIQKASQKRVLQVLIFEDNNDALPAAHNG